MIQEIVGDQRIPAAVCKVTEVQDYTCTVKRLLDGDELTNVRLSAGTDPEKGMLCRPAEDSIVLVSELTEVDRFVSMFGDLESATMQIGGIKFVMNQDGVVLNDGENGMVKIVELTGKINELVQKVNALISAYNGHTHITTATIGPGPTVGVISPTTSQAQTASTLDKSDYEDEKIKH
ncbi:MAG TPA: hypothetical protein PLP11_07405 [Bacteroidales bacterium]|nr:hypothetical protein [Bacteroidales bacterium]